MATPLTELIPLELFPSDRVTSEASPLAVLERILVNEFESQPVVPGPGDNVTVGLTVADEVALAFPGLDGIALVVGGADASTLLIQVRAAPGDVKARLSGGARFRFSREWLRPVVLQDRQWVDDTSRPFAEIAINASILVDQDWVFTFEGTNEFALAPSMIADTGFVIEGTVAIDLSDTQSLPETLAMGLGPTWRGAVFKSLTLHLPDDLQVPILPSDLTLTNFHIGSGGLSGSVRGNWSPSVTGSQISGNGAGTLFGMSFGLKSFELDLLQNAVTGFGIKGVLGLPFFDQVLEVDLNLDLDGNFSIVVDDPSGLAGITIASAGVEILQAQIDNLTVEHQEGVLVVAVGGLFTPRFGGLDWPAFKVEKLSIDSEGNVKLAGGWLDLPEQYALDFHGFQFEITKLGFGKTDDGGKWVGFSGGLKLVDGLSAGASVEGLRLTWYEDGRSPAISLNGVGVEFEVPEVLRFMGEVAYRELPGEVHRFDGQIKLELLTLGLQIDAQLVVGYDADDGYAFFAIYLGIDLPAGIPLWSTGLALYGLEGLFALAMEPDKTLPENADEAWYAIGGANSWFHRGTIGVTDLEKWTNRQGSLGLGGGVTIGTLPDNGFTFAGRMLLVIIFPGPILLIEGAANLLKERSSLDEEPLFRALAVLDGRAGTFLVGLDAQYKYGGGGELIDISGGAEAFFSLSAADAWHLYLGQKEPREKRIRAQILSLWEANTYFMLDADQLAFGAWVGYDKQWRFGPLRVTLEAWIEGNAIVSWKPAHLYGDLWLHGKVELAVFGFGLGLSLDARFAADVFDPFHVLAEFSVGINLPWPLPDFDATITLEWGPEPTPPLLPMPLKEVAVEHFKTTVSWPLRRGALLLPVYDGDGDGLLDDGDRDGTPNPAGGMGQPADLDALAVVPLDARPHITFGRTVHDDALLGVNAQPVSPALERIGDPAADEGPATVRYGLKEVALERWSGSAWEPVARKAATFSSATSTWEVQPNPAGVETLYGSWAPVPALPAGNPAPGSDPAAANVKLWLWSKTPFDYTRHTGRAWDEWFTDRFSHYPCIPDAPDREICCDFEHLQPGEIVRLPYVCTDRRGIVIAAGDGEFEVVALQPPVRGKTRALCSTGKPWVEIWLGTPAGSVEVTVAPQEAGPAERECIDFREWEEGRRPNPLQAEGVAFLVLGRDGQPVVRTEVRDFGNGRGLNLGFAAEIDLPCPATDVRLRLSQHGSPVAIKALDATGNGVSDAQVPPDPDGVTTVALDGQGIVRLLVDVPQDETLLQELCFLCQAVSTAGVTAVGFNGQGDQFGPFQADDNVVRVEGEELRRVQVLGEGRLCLVQVCANVGPDPAEVLEREEMAQHLVDELARWQDEGEVLQPHSYYRLKLVTTVQAVGEGSLSGYALEQDVTEYAYFRTAGPPGLATLSIPEGHPNPDEFVKNNGLSDLMLYVRQTVPPTVQASGEKPPLPRPVYRAYDVGVEFNEDYVDLMYRVARRDLGLYLYDNSNRPVRDALGRLIVLSNRWGVTEDLTLAESEERWITVINASTCAALDPTVIPHDKTLTAAAPGQVLDPDTLYEARLIPLLLHEDFGAFTAGQTTSGPGGTLGAWRVVDTGANSGPSQWRIDETGTPPSRYAEQTTNIWGGTVDANDPAKPGTLLVYATNPTLPATHADQPALWTDYRFTVYVRSADDDAIGVVFRYQDANNYYRFSMDRERRYRRLVRFVAGAALVLAEDDFVYRQDQDYLITVEAIGDDLAVYQDGQLVFRVSDPALNTGAVGLYCWASQGARFTDVRVDDYRVDAAPVVYRFEFVTSDFSHFLHHLHSYQDETWRLALDAAALTDPALAALVTQAVAPAAAPTEDEARAYQVLADAALGAASHQNPAELRVSRVERDGETIALLVESPEPIDWTRTDLALLRADQAPPTPALPSVAKLTGVSFGSSMPNEESVDLLLRDAADLSGHQIEYRALPGPLDEPSGNPLLFKDDFASGERGLLFRETFGPNALDHYAVVDEGTSPPSSNWEVSGGHIVQTTNIWGGSVSGAPEHADKPGTMAVTGAPGWENVRITVGLRSTDDDAIGLVFRYQDPDNYYRFSMDRERSYRRLVKKVAGTLTVLWQDDVAYNLGQAYELTIEVYGDRLLGSLDQLFLFSVQDTSLARGQVGLYCWANVGAHFEKLEVEGLESPPLLWQPALEDLSELTVVDAAGAVTGPSQWQAAAGVLTQSADVHVPGVDPEHPGTYAVGGSAGWTDVQVSVRLSATDDGAMGVLLRYVDEDNYYRFSMDRQQAYRRLIKKVGGVVSVLWQDNLPFNLGQPYDLTIRAVGPHLTGYLDGVQLFSLADADLARGRVGFYCWANTGATFERILVTDRTRRLGPWTMRDEGSAAGPSTWLQRGGALLQTSNINDGSPVAEIAKAGTYAVAGSESWTDYRLAVRLRSDSDDAIGVIARYVDADNYYRLSLDRQRGYRRLVRKQNGLFTTLWQDSSAYTVGEPFTLTLDVAGPRLVGYQGDTQLFDVSDGAHAAGRVGLYGWGNSGMRFEHVEVRRLPLEAYALFRDRFAFGDMSAWTVVDEGTLSAPSNWALSGGALRQSSNIHSQPVDGSHPDKRGTQVVAGDPTWTDLVLTAELQSLDDDAIGLLFRYQDADNTYRFSMDRERRYRRLVKNVGGVCSVLWEDDVAYELGRSYRATLVLQGSTLRGYLDDVPMFVVEDGDLAAGRVGLYCWANVDARFSNVRVYALERLFGAWLLDEPFDVELPGRWQFVDDGDQSAPSAWAFAGGELQQTSDIWGGALDPADADKPGTHALAGDAAWSDYRVSVRLASDDDAIGLIFRYQDEDNYYRFSMDRERSYRRLVKKVGGAVTTLWEDGTPYVLGRPYLVTADCQGSRLQVYLDGVELITVHDGDLTTGKVGLYCWRNSAARFSELRVAGPAWRTYYIFGDEERMPAGSRLRVYAGNANAAPTPQPNTQPRFVAALQENGRLRLPATGVDLRLVDAAGNTGHTRHFLPASAYSALGAATILRKADGTGLFLFMPAGTAVGSRLPAGQYRLRLTYRRDNKALDAHSIVFKELGNSDPETATLDVPWGLVND